MLIQLTLLSHGTCLMCHDIYTYLNKAYVSVFLCFSIARASQVPSRNLLSLLIWLHDSSLWQKKYYKDKFNLSFTTWKRCGHCTVNAAIKLCVWKVLHSSFFLLVNSVMNRLQNFLISGYWWCGWLPEYPPNPTIWICKVWYRSGRNAIT